MVAIAYAVPTRRPCGVQNRVQKPALAEDVIVLRSTQLTISAYGRVSVGLGGSDCS